MSDKPQIEFFEFKARKFCVWFDAVTDSGDYDGIRATHVVSGLIASAAKLMRIRIAGTQQACITNPVPSTRRAPPADDFPVKCRSDWAEICGHRNRTGGLPGCLAEVRSELQGGLDLLDAKRPYDAISYWQLGYVHNWGELAICAMMMMHSDLANARSS